VTERPATFIGSSSEGVAVADAVKANLASYTDCTVWHEDVFLPGQFYFEALEQALDRMDYAILVATPDDLLTKRHVANFTMRDNVLLELGLFMAKLGRRRTYLMSPRDRPIHIPSDLLGVETVTYDFPSDADASTGPAAALVKPCATIEAAMRQAEQDLSLAVKRALARDLLRWVTKVQGLVIAMQAESLKLLGGQEEVARIRREMRERLAETLAERRGDADRLGLREPYEAVGTTVMDALERLPFPAEAALSRNEITGLGADLLSGRQSLEHVKARGEGLVASYQAWWREYAPRIGRDLHELQIALIDAI
jgi:hypothetical protein